MNDIHWMKEALKEAQKSEQKGEVPVGAVLVLDGKIIARGHNLPISKNDPTAHAEIICLRRAGQRLQNYRLSDTILYVTVEPCTMCAGALIWARVKKVVFGCPDPKAGACGSVFDLSKVKAFNHRYEVKRGVLENACRQIIQQFFKRRRRKINSF